MITFTFKFNLDARAQGKSFPHGSGVHLQPSQDGKREVNNDETAPLDRAADPGLSEVVLKHSVFVKTDLVAF